MDNVTVIQALRRLCHRNVIHVTRAVLLLCCLVTVLAQLIMMCDFNYDCMNLLIHLEASPLN